jgi:ABC-type nickel/cobalt efflux system permease component RcnA
MARRGQCVKFLLALLLATLAQTARPFAAYAHPVDEFLQNTYLSISPDAIDVEVNLTAGVGVAPEVIQVIDANGDGVLTEAESRLYAERVRAGIVLTLDGKPLALVLVRVEMPALAIIRAGAGEIRAAFSATVSSLATGPHELYFENKHAPVASAYQVALLKPRADVLRIRGQQRSANGADITVDFVSDSATASAMDPGAKPPDIAPAETAMPLLDRLTELQRAQLTPGGIAAATALALVLGGLHALTPGHSKTLVAAYLIGSRGTLRHAVLLGVVVTVTHMASVLAVGGLMLLAGNAVLPGTLVPVLELISGVLVVVLGARLLLQRWRASKMALTMHTHAASMPHTHAGGMGAHTHTTRGGIFTMGASGGLVPCPEALGVLLVAVGAGRIGFGIGLIAMFSFGLAAVLIALGIVVVHARPLLSGIETRGQRLQRWVPIFSAAVVTALGMIVTVRAVGQL